MLFDHLPKFNIALGALALLCFFLPWVSFDCGEITLVKLSGFELATGRMPIDSGLLQQASASMGVDPSAVEEFQQDPHAQPQFHLFLIVVSAAIVIGFGVRMFDEANRVGIFGSGGFSLVSLLLLLFTALSQFGSAIPPDAGIFISSSLQIGFYGTCFSFLGVIVLAFVWMKEDAGWTFGRTSVLTSDDANAPVAIQVEDRPEPSIGQPVMEPLVEEDVKTGEDELNVFEFPEPQKIDPVQTKPAPAPPGAKTCPSCGVIVGPYQVKCIKCGAKLKTRG